MPDLLLELFSEEIPARMQARAADDLKKLVADALVDAGLTYEGAVAHVTPRRLALHLVNLPPKAADLREERKGPRVGAPDKAVEGFLKSVGLASVDEAKIVSDEKKGDYYVALIERTGRAAEEIIAEAVPEVIRRFPWPKSMRWGAGQLRWVRPLHSILCTFGPETEETEVVPFEVDGIRSGDVTFGHRFHAPEAISVRRFEDYVASLANARVVLDAAERRAAILNEATTLAFAQGFDLVPDDALLAEVAGLVEWPVVLMGTFDESFLDVPPEVLTTSMKAHQKCFSVRDGKTGALANRFILVSNLQAEDGGKEIVAGNERVIAARLSDARFFWESDKKTPLTDRVEKLKEIVFHEKLGTQHERTERLVRLAGEIAAHTGADVEQARRAALLSKADLVTEMVGEFPELQGLMGRYYAQAQGEDEAVARAIEEHYRPQGPNDSVPTDKVAIAVALADKLDMLTGFWAIDEKPTGSKDPYALRRAALGVIRIVLENELSFSLNENFESALLSYISVNDYGFEERVRKILAGQDIVFYEWHEISRELFSSKFLNYDLIMEKWDDLIDDTISTEYEGLPEVLSKILERAEALSGYISAKDISLGRIEGSGEEVSPSLRAALPKLRSTYLQPALSTFSSPLLAFFADRLKVHLREQGARHDLIDAVFALGNQDDLLMIVRRVEALGAFLATDDGANLLAGVKRGTNILRIEEKKDGRSYDGPVDGARLTEPAEIKLANVLDDVASRVSARVEEEDFEGAMKALAELRPAVDAFFDHVTVNADDAALRENRLKLLNRLREATLQVADFSRIEG